MSGYAVAQIDGIDEISDGPLSLAACPVPLWYHVLRRQCVHSSSGGRSAHQRARRVTGA